MDDKRFRFRQIEDAALFDGFVKDNGGSVFQTLAWAGVKKEWRPRAFMGFDGDTPVISCLCLERRISILGKLWYAAEGFAGKCDDPQLIKGFISFLRSQMASFGVFGLCADPRYVTCRNGEKCDNAEFRILIDAGMKERKDGSYTVQPPTDIVVPVKAKNTEELLSACEKGVRHGYKTGLECGLRQEVYDSESKDLSSALDTFFGIMTQTADRVEFVHRTKDYYASILSRLGKDASLMLVYYDRDGEREKYTSSLAKIKSLNEDLSHVAAEDKKKTSELKKAVAAEEKKTATFEKAEKELTDADVSDGKIYLAGGITSYFGDESVCLYGGTANVLRNTLRPTHYLNCERLISSASSGCRTHSMGRVTGDPYDEKNPLSGLVAYKRSYGGDIIQYCPEVMIYGGIGFKMKLFTDVFPKVRHFRATAMRRILNGKNENKN